jgi:aminoglycoside phosphotransferase (APT) family kinase protein
MARDLHAMTAALRAYLDGGDRITGIRTLSAGHSNETYLIEGLDRVLRTPPSEEGLLPPYDMARQHAILRAVHGWDDALPIPRVHELCTDETIIGAPFFVMETLDGEAFEFALPDWLSREPETMADALCRQWFGALTALHRMPVGRMVPGGRDVVEEARYWRDVAMAAEASPRLIEVLQDLVRRPPKTSGPSTPVHGDPKHGNCLWNQGRLVGLLDWEMAQVSEPLIDLGYILMFHDQGEAGLANAGFELPGWWSPARMIAAWEAATGRTAVDVARYAVLGQAKVTAIIEVGYQLFKSGRTSDRRFESWGLVLPGFTRLLSERADAA